MRVLYDYDEYGYTVQLVCDSYVEDEASLNPVDNLGNPVKGTSVSVEAFRRWALETALDFIESYDVDGDPVRDTTIRGGKR